MNFSAKQSSDLYVAAPEKAQQIPLFFIFARSYQVSNPIRSIYTCVGSLCLLTDAECGFESEDHTADMLCVWLCIFDALIKMHVESYLNYFV